MSTFRKLRRDNLVMLLILGAVLLVTVYPFFCQGIPHGHDLQFHLLRIVSLAEELGNGQFPVRMATTVNNGFGYPHPIYYCDLFLYPSALLYMAGVPLGICYKLYVFAESLATIILTWIPLRKLTKDPWICLAGTTLYILSAYHITNLCVRGALGEFTAMAFLPMTAVGTYFIYQEGTRPAKSNAASEPGQDPGAAPAACHVVSRRTGWLYLGLGMAGIIQSHTLTAVMVVQNLIVLVFILWRRTFKKDVFLSFVKAAALAAGLSAWFIVPLLECMIRQKTVIQLGHYRRLAESAKPLWALLSPFPRAYEEQRYITLGLPLILVLSLLIGFLVGDMLRAMIRRSRKPAANTTNATTGSATDAAAPHPDVAISPASTTAPLAKPRRVFTWVCIVNFILLWKKIPWDLVQGALGGRDGFGYTLGQVQLVWRYLGLSVTALVIAFVIGMEEIRTGQTASAQEPSDPTKAPETPEQGAPAKPRLSSRLKLIYSILAILAAAQILLVAVYYPMFDKAVVKEKWVTMTPAKGTDELYLLEGTNWWDELPHGRSEVLVAQGDADVLGYSKVHGTATLELLAREDSRVVLPIYAYYGYHVVDEAGRRYSYRPSEDIPELDGTQTMRISFDVDGSEDPQTFRIYFREPIGWRLAELITLLTLAGLIYAAVRAGHTCSTNI